MNDLKELSRQGFVCEERRRDRKYHKLRFRSGGRQVVRYVGGAELAAALKNELSILQYESRVMRDLKAKMKIANMVLREAKILMEPVLKANGLVFHGFAVREPRRRRNDVSNSKSNSKP